MQNQSLEDTLRSHDIPIYHPTSAAAPDVARMFLNSPDTSWTFASLSDPERKIEFLKDYSEMTGREFLTVTYISHGIGEPILYEDENGHQIGDLSSDVDDRMEAIFGDGFYLEDQAMEEIDDYSHLVDEDADIKEKIMDRLAEEYAGSDDFGTLVEIPEEFAILEDGSIPENGIEEGFEYDEEILWDDVEEFDEFGCPIVIPEEYAIPDEVEQEGQKEGEIVQEEKEGPTADSADQVEPTEKKSPEEIEIDEKQETKINTLIEKMENPSEELKSFLGKIDNETTEALGSGFIPVALREGYTGNRGDNPVITSELVQEIRDKYDPEFGIVCGVDTSKFVTSKDAHITGEQPTVSMIKLSVDDIKEYITNPSIEEKDVKSVFAYKEYGQSIDVQGKPFGVNNIVTFEIKVERDGETKTFKSSLVMDDMGVCRGNLFGTATDFEHTLPLSARQSVSRTELMYIKAFDRTCTDNRGCFHGIRDVDAFKQEANEKIPAFLEQFNKDYYEKMESKPDKPDEFNRNDYLQATEKIMDNRLDSLQKDTNIVGLYKEKLAADVYRSREAVVDVIDRAVSIKKELNNADKDSDVYKEYSKKFDEIKEEYASKYRGYIEAKTKNDSVKKVDNAFRENYLSLSIKNDHVINDDKRMNLDFDGTARYKRDENITTPRRFGIICENIAVRTQVIPTWLNIDVKGLKEQYSGVVKEAVNEIGKVVNEFNESKDVASEKINFPGIVDGEVVQPATKDGFEIQADGIKGQNGFETAYREDRDSEKKTKIEMGKDEYTGESKVVVKGMDEKATGSQLTRAEIYNSFKEDTIKRGCKNIHLTQATYDYKDSVAKGYYTPIPDIAIVRGDLVPIEDKIIKEVKVDTGIDKGVESSKDKAIDNDKEHNVDKKSETKQSQGVERNNQEFKENDSTNSSKQDKSSPKSYGSTNDDKRAECSDSKKNDIRDKVSSGITAKEKDRLYKEAKAEIKGSNVDKDKIDSLYKQKLDALIEKKYENALKTETAKLEMVRSDILKYKEKMEIFSALPDKMKSQHGNYQLLKANYDCAINAYEKMGGKVGKDCFVAKGVSNLEVRLTQNDFANSNYVMTRVYDKYLGLNTEKFRKDITKDLDGNQMTGYAKHAIAVSHRMKLTKLLLARPLALVEGALWPRKEIKIENIASELARRVDKLEKENTVEKKESDNTAKKEDEKDSVDNENDPKDDNKVAQEENKEDSVEQEEGEDDSVDQEEDKEASVDQEEGEDDSVDQEEDKEDSVDQEEDKDDSVDQEEGEDDSVDQEEDKEDSVDKEEDKEDSIDQEEGEDDSVDQEEDKDDSVDQEEGEDDSVDQEEDKDDSVDQEEDKEDSVDQEEGEDDSVDQEEDKEDSVDQEEDKDDSVEQEEDKEDSVDKEEGEDDSVDQEEDKEDSVDQEEGEDDSVDQEEDKEDSVGQEEDKDDSVDKEEGEEDSVEQEEGEEDSVSQERGEEYVHELNQNVDSPDDKISKDETKNDDLKTKDDAMVSSQNVDVQSTPLDISENIETNEDAHSVAADSDSEALLDDVKEKINDVIDGKEELNIVMDDFMDKVVDGLDPMDLFDAMCDSFESYLNTGMDIVEAVGDIVFDFGETFFDKATEFFDTALEKLSDFGDSFKENVIDQISDNFDRIFECVPDIVSFEYEDLSFSYDATEMESVGVDNISSENPVVTVQDAYTDSMDLDINNLVQDNDPHLTLDNNSYNDLSNDNYISASDFIDSVDDVTNDGTVENNIDACQLVNDITYDLFDQGVELPESIQDQIFNQIESDAANGVDISNSDYLQEMTNQAMELNSELDQSLMEVQNNDVEYAKDDFNQDDIAKIDDPYDVTKDINSNNDFADDYNNRNDWDQSYGED